MNFPPKYQVNLRGAFAVARAPRVEKVTSDKGHRYDVKMYDARPAVDGEEAVGKVRFFAKTDVGTLAPFVNVDFGDGPALDIEVEEVRERLSFIGIATYSMMLFVAFSVGMFVGEKRKSKE